MTLWTKGPMCTSESCGDHVPPVVYEGAKVISRCSRPGSSAERAWR